MKGTFPPMEYLRGLTGGKPVPESLYDTALPSYIHPNPLVRWWAWKRVTASQRLLGACSGELAVDLGCGFGVMLDFLSKRYSRVIGVDLAPENAEMVRRDFSLANVTVEKRDGRALSLESGCADLLVALDVLEHIPDLAVEASEIQRVLKPGGLLLVCVPTENFLYRVGRRVLTHFARHAAYHLRSGTNVLSLLANRFLELRRTAILPILTCSLVVLYERPKHSRAGVG